MKDELEGQQLSTLGSGKVFRDQIHVVWDAVPVDYLRRLIEAMP